MRKFTYPLSALFLFPILLEAQAPDFESAWDKDTISVHTAKEAVTVREKINAYIWGDTPVMAQPVRLEENVDLRSDLRNDLPDLTNLRSADRITIPLEHGFESVVYVLHPRKSNHSHVPLIYHSGHNIVFFHEDLHVNDSGACAISVLNFFLGKGFDIIGISMPLVGYNTHPDLVREHGHEIPINRHDDLFQLDHPFYYFLEPVKAALDFLSGRQGYTRYMMMGLSGGGWTTTLYSAIDTRIWLSFPVAGSIPIALRTSNKDAGDKEQYYADFYDRFSYSTLYLLAADGQGRHSCQILNEKDDCCFAFDGNAYWVPAVDAELNTIGEPRHFQFYQDTCAPFHKVSAAAVQKIYVEIRDAFKREGRRL